MSRVFSSCPRLKQLTLLDCTMLSDTTLLSVAGSLPAMVELSVGGNAGFTLTGVGAVNGFSTPGK